MFCISFRKILGRLHMTCLAEFSVLMDVVSFVQCWMDLQLPLNFD